MTHVSIGSTRIDTPSSPYSQSMGRASLGRRLLGALTAHVGVSRALAGIAILAALAVGLVLSSVGPLQAAEESYAENGTAAVATFTAADPEGKTIVWSLAGVDVGVFSIANGVLTFDSPPDFEAAADVGMDNTYNVIVRAGDGGTPFAIEMVTVMVTNVEEPGTVMLSTLQPQVGTSVTATLSDPDTGMFDADSVEWEWFRGSNAIAGATNPSYTPGSADIGYVLRATATYMDEEDADTEKSAQVESAHAVRAMPSSNIDPVFPNQTPGNTQNPNTDQERKVAENTPAGEDIGVPVAATDADVLTYSLAVADAESFSIDRATGQLKTKAALDHEGTPSYIVMVMAADPFGASATATVTIAVTDVNEAPEIASVATPAIDHEENTAAATPLATYAAMDLDMGDDAVLEWSLSGVDAGQFDIVEADGQLTFMEAPDFESPGDSDEDNVYEVTVVVTDSEGNSDELEVTVKVGNVEEGGEITLSTLQPRVGFLVTATLADPDNITADSVSWQWYRGTVDTSTLDTSTLPEECAETTEGTCAIKGAASDTYTPVADDVDDTLTAVAQYTDGSPNDGDAKDVVGEPAAQLVLADTRNKAPVFPDQEGETDQELTVPENTAADTDISDGLVAATDSEDLNLDYTLGGTDAASFSIVRTSGQLQTKAKLDYETKETYEVEVTATDSLGVSSTITVTINVGDVDEMPDLEGEAPSKYAENGTAPVATFTATDPEGASIVWTLGGANEMDFSIEGGVLRFNSSPDYEDTNNMDHMYAVTIQASDGGGADFTATKEVTIEVTNVEEPGTVMLSTLQPQVATPVTATLTDPDVAEGTVVWKWSRGRNVIVTAADPTYTPTVDDVGYTLRAEATYTDGEGEDKSANAASVRTVRAAPSSNNEPVFPDQDLVMQEAQTDQERKVAENTPADEDIGVPVAATDADVLTYSLDTGNDAASFSIDRATGQLKTKEALDYEDETNVVHMYTVMVTATDPFGASATATVTIEVTDVNEAPSVDGAASIDHDENGTMLDIDADEDGVQTATYTAIDLDEDDTTELSLEGADSSKFGISAVGLLAFMSAPDFESPADANQDNVYEVTVVVTDSEDIRDELDVTVKVGNVEEGGVITLSAVQPRVGVPLTATLTDPDGDITDLEWQWSKNSADIKDATSDIYVPVADDINDTLTVTATYTDGMGDNKDEASAPATGAPPENNVVADTRNKAPVFPDKDDAMEGQQTDQERSVAENTASGMPIGPETGEDGAVVAEDFITANNGDKTAETLDYTLGGTDAASFSIHRGTARLSTKAKLDYEAKKSYTVEVTATDPSNATATVTVTIKVTDVDEEPVITVGGLAISGTARVDYAEDRRDPVATYMASGPDADMATWSLEGADADDFAISSSGGELTFVSGPDYENAMDANMDNTYMVTVKADDGTYMDTHEVTVRVTEVEDDVVTPGDSVVDMYDTNNSGRIDKGELVEAILDYNINETLSKADLVELILSYEIG